ncbi:MAG: NADAR family protein [Verrucomicrobia bacterium]|nr:NADAR family protein [Verrucomicrobiota bacterium]
MLTYKKSDVAWFFTKTSPRWELSNMSVGFPIYWPLERKPENLWYSTEQLYQASKYSTAVMCLPSPSSKADPCVRNRIRKDPTPLGSKITQDCAVKAGLVRKDWEAPTEVRLKSMAWVLELKLHFHPDTFGRVLRETGDQPIVEISTKDEFWACLNQPNGELKGENYLGRLLMRLRGRMPQVTNGEFTFPDGHLLP